MEIAELILAVVLWFANDMTKTHYHKKVALLTLRP
jgi:hypothetical protein